MIVYQALQGDVAVLEAFEHSVSNAVAGDFFGWIADVSGFGWERTSLDEREYELVEHFSPKHQNVA